MSDVHKQLMSLKLLANCSRDQRACSSIDVHRPSFPDIPSLAAPTSHGPSPEADGCQFKKYALGLG